MKRELVHERQPFGLVEDMYIHLATMANKAPQANRPGSDMEVGNNARDHNVPIVDPSYGYEAYKHASRHRDHPFYPTGHPKKGV